MVDIFLCPPLSNSSSFAVSLLFPQGKYLFLHCMSSGGIVKHWYCTSLAKEETHGLSYIDWFFHAGSLSSEWKDSVVEKAVGTD